MSHLPPLTTQPLRGIASQFHHMRACVPACAYSRPAGLAQAISAHTDCSRPFRQPGVAYGKPSQWRDSSSAANHWAGKLPFPSVAEAHFVNQLPAEEVRKTPLLP